MFIHQIEPKISTQILNRPAAKYYHPKVLWLPSNDMRNLA